MRQTPTICNLNLALVKCKKKVQMKQKGNNLEDEVYNLILVQIPVLQEFLKSMVCQKGELTIDVLNLPATVKKGITKLKVSS